MEQQQEGMTEETVILEENVNEADGGKPQSEPETPAVELAELNEKYLRLAAEYDNFRKRNARERETLVTESQHFTIKQFLPVLDNLERAAAQPCNDEAYAQGVVMIVKQWLELMEKLGVTPIDALGKPFDPNLHNAVMHADDENFPENTVAEVFQKGYMSGDKVLRPSMVKAVN